MQIEISIILFEEKHAHHNPIVNNGTREKNRKRKPKQILN